MTDPEKKISENVEELYHFIISRAIKELDGHQ